ncbi:MAG: hypothetical protein U0271_00015 [Polyangiaceae bacterium]
MTVTVVVNTRTVVHHGSRGKAHGFGDVCRTADDQTVPFVNLAQSEDAADCAATVSTDVAKFEHLSVGPEGVRALGSALTGVVSGGLGIVGARLG